MPFAVVRLGHHETPGFADAGQDAALKTLVIANQNFPASPG